MAVTAGDEVKRAVAVINAAIRSNMFPAGVMPESDADKLAEANKLVVMCGQAKKVADAIGPTRVNNYQAVMEILTEAGVDTNGAAPAVAPAPPQEAQSSPPPSPASQPSVPPSTSSPQAPTTSVPVMSGQPVTHSPASAVSPPSSPSPSPEQAPPAAAHPVDPNGVLAEPKVGEEWDAAGGGRWLMIGDQGAMVEAISRATGEQTVLPKGFLKNKMTEAFVNVEVDPEWHVQGARGYNTLWYTHPGCVRWYAPLDDCFLPIVGSTVQCVTCDAILPVVHVEPNGYVPTPAANTQPPIEEVQSQVVTKKINEIHLRAEPELGVKVYEHPGCSSWQAPLVGADGVPTQLMQVGVQGPCPKCGDQDVPLTVVETNGYDPSTYGQAAPAQPPAQPVQEAQPSTQQPEQSSQQSSPASPAASPTPTPSAPTTPTSAPAPSSTAPPSAPVAPSSPSSSSTRSTGAPVDDHEGDAEYARILDQAESDFLPTGMPAPQDLESPPPSMPEDLTANPEANRELHSKFNALAARARYLAKIDERVARDCGRAVRLRIRPHLAKAKKELGASSTLTERREWAEEIGGEDVKLWLERQQKHADRAEAYGEFFHIYSGYVSVLSRDLTWAQNEERGS